MSRKILTLYYRGDDGPEILERGFEDATSNFGLANTTLTGVQMATVDAPNSDGVSGDNYCVMVDIPEEEVKEYELVEEGKPYREFVVPADVLNGFDQWVFNDVR